MAATREKAISYRRAEWFVDGPAVATLEEYLQRVHRKLKTVAERTYKRESGQCIRSVKKQSPHGGGIFIHITADTPGEEASIVLRVKVVWKSMSERRQHRRARNSWMVTPSSTSTEMTSACV